MRYIFMRFPEGKAKALTLSYDDGSVHDRKLIEIADRYGLKVTLNISTDYMDAVTGRHLLAEELKELVTPGGHEIAVHGARHIAPGKVSKTVGICDILRCRQRLEKAFDSIIRGMAYPDSGIYKILGPVPKEEIKAYVKDLGIAYARSLAGDNDRFELPADWYEWIPTAHHKNPELMNWLEKFLESELPSYGAVRMPQLFYLWGHSVEFHDAGNWDLFERFCQKAGGHEDVWYATNIAICDYVKGFDNLVFDVERTKVYNPSVFPIWVEADKIPLRIDPGQTVLLPPEEPL